LFFTFSRPHNMNKKTSHFSTYLLTMVVMMLSSVSLAGRSAATGKRSLTTVRRVLAVPQPQPHHRLPLLSSSLVSRASWVPVHHGHQLAHLQQCQGRVFLSTTTTTASTTSSSASSSKSQSDGSTGSSNSAIGRMSNLILDHLGSIFLTAIGLVIATLVRSYYGTARKNALRDRLEAAAALDPLELHELRLANPRFTATVFRSVMERLYTQQQDQDQQTATGGGVPSMTYAEFCVAVREILQTQHDRPENPIPTIELGHYLDRVVLQVLQHPVTNGSNSSCGGSSSSRSSSSEQPQSLTLWLVVLSLALSGPTSDRIQVLYEILQRETSSMMVTASRRGGGEADDLDLMLERNNSSTDGNSSTVCHNHRNIVTLAQVHALVGYLQSTCQLVIDNQLLATPEKKYPIQDYHQGRPEELVQWTTNHQHQGGVEVQDKSNDMVKSSSETDVRIDVDALADILRSKSVCAWGECYRKKRML
jgi:hypothetical protein